MFFGGENIVGLALHGDLAVFHGDNVIGVGGGLVDVVQDDDGGAFVFVGQPAQDLHEGAGMIHVEVVQRFVQQNVVGALTEHHGNHGALALAAGKLGQVAVGKVLQVELCKRFFDDGFVVFRRPALVVGIAAEHEQVANGNAAHDAVFLGEDGERAGEFGGGGSFDVFACVADVAVYQGLQARHKERRVDLPAPFGPISAVMPPSGMSRLTSLRMGLLPMVWLTLRMVIIGGSENGN